MVLIPLDQLARMTVEQRRQWLLAACAQPTRPEHVAFADRLLELTVAGIAELFDVCEDQAAAAAPMLREIAGRLRGAR